MKGANDSPARLTFHAMAASWEIQTLYSIDQGLVQWAHIGIREDVVGIESSQLLSNLALKTNLMNQLSLGEGGALDVLQGD